MIDEHQKTIKSIAVYGRVSTARQEEENTIKTQLSAVREFAQKNNFVIVQEYLDDGWSGDSIVRPALDQLRMDAKKKVWEAVLFYDPDRLARRYSYQELVMDELRELGIEPLFVTIPPSKNTEDRLMYGVRGVFAEYERVKIAERFRLGKVRKAKEGHIIATEAPYGYKFILKTPEKQGYYKIDEREAEIVKAIFSWVANDGLTIRGIVRKLQDLDIPPRKSKRGVWSTSTLSTLLRNKTYIGEGHYGASYAVIPKNPLKQEAYRKIKKTSRCIKPESEWIKIATPKIIDEDLFIRVGKRLRSNYEMCVRNTKNEYLLSGKIWCDCGARRAGEGPQHGKHLYYRCTDRVHSFPLPSKCGAKGINARIVDSLVWGEIVQLMSSPELLLAQVKEWVNKQKSNNKTPVINIDTIQREIDKLKQQEQRYITAFGEGVMTLNQFKEYSFPLKEKISSFENQVRKSQSESKQINETPLPDKNELEVFVKKASIAIKNLNFISKKAIINNIIEKVIGNKQYLLVVGNISAEFEKNVSLCSIDWDGANTNQHAVDMNSIPFSVKIDLKTGVPSN